MANSGITVYAPGLSVEVLDNAVIVPPTTGKAPGITRVPLNLSQLICLNAMYAGGAAYDRWANHLCLSGTPISLAFGSKSVAGGGALLNFAYPRYGLLVNGVQRATYTVLGSEKIGTFTGALGAEPDGVALLEIVAYDAAGALVTAPIESPVPFGVSIDRTGQAKNAPDVWVQTGSHAWTHESYGIHAYVRMPKTLLQARSFPFTPRAAVPFATALPSSQITREMLAPTCEANSMQTYKPCVSNRGITVTENMQGYFPRDMFDAFPRLPQLDGVRGTATVYYPLHIKPGRNGKWYFTTPHSLCVIDATGTKWTLAGLRHKYAPYWAHATANGPEVELIGDWSAVPAARRVIWESWGFAWDERTLALDNAAPPIGGDQPHVGAGPVLFLVDRFNRVLKLQFSATNRPEPPIITEFIVGLNDPWSIVFDPANNQLYVSERGAHRISKWSADTGAYLGDVIANATGSQYGSVPAGSITRRFAWAAGHSITTARTANIVAPESLALQDGFLYWGALAQAEARRITLATGLVEVCARPSTNFGGVGPYFVNIALSDGTFGPRGTLFTVTFYNAEYGRPQAFLPIAGSTTHSQLWNWQGYGYDLVRGSGGTWSNDAYPTACAVGNGMLASGSSLDGLNVYRQRDTADGPNIDYARVTRGHNFYKGKSYDLVHGKYAHGYTSLPLPWGENADQDYFFRAVGR